MSTKSKEDKIKSFVKIPLEEYNTLLDFKRVVVQADNRAKLPDVDPDKLDSLKIVVKQEPVQTYQRFYGYPTRDTIVDKKYVVIQDKKLTALYRKKFEEFKSQVKEARDKLHKAEIAFSAALENNTTKAIAYKKVKELRIKNRELTADNAMLKAALNEPCVDKALEKKYYGLRADLGALMADSMFGVKQSKIQKLLDEF